MHTPIHLLHLCGWVLTRCVPHPGSMAQNDNLMQVSSISHGFRYVLCLDAGQSSVWSELGFPQQHQYSHVCDEPNAVSPEGLYSPGFICTRSLEG